MRIQKIFFLLAFLPLAFCAGCREEKPAPPASKDWTMQRKKMVDEQIRRRGVRAPEVLRAVSKVERHLFVPESQVDSSYSDSPLPIGKEQTISQPYIVALMTELLEPKPDDKVLEIGTGSGYQAAVLAEIVDQVYTIEIIESLGRRAEKTLQEHGYSNVTVRIGDGFAGWPEEAPFDKIIVTAAPETIPAPLLEQLAEGGRLVIPVGGRDHQELRVVTKTNGKIEDEPNIPVRFVPMTGRVQEE